MEAAPSSTVELISCTSMGAAHVVSLFSGLVVIQKSCAPTPPGRSETINIVRPSAVTVGENSLYLEFKIGPKFFTTSFAKALLPVSGVTGGVGTRRILRESRVAAVEGFQATLEMPSRRRS